MPDTYRDRFRRWLESGERLTFRLAAKVVFLVVLLLLAAVSIAANSMLLALLAALFASLMLRAILPTQRFQAVARSYWSGEAGDRWRRRFDRAVAWVKGVLPG